MMIEHVEHLAGLLEQEADAYSRLLEIERDKEKAIVANDAEGLLEALAREEPAAEEANALEREILALRDALAAAAARPGITLRDVIASLPASEAARLEKLRTRLFGYAEEIRRINQTNYLLLKQSIELLDHVLAAVLGEPATASTYCETGRMKCCPAPRETLSIKA